MIKCDQVIFVICGTTVKVLRSAQEERQKWTNLCALTVQKNRGIWDPSPWGRGICHDFMACSPGFNRFLFDRDNKSPNHTLFIIGAT